MNEIEKALKDIAEMKKAIKNNILLVRPLFTENRLISFSLCMAFFCLIYFCSMEAVIVAYGSLSAMPLCLMIIYIATALVFLIFSSIYKFHVINTKLRENTYPISFLRLMFREFRAISANLLILGVLFIALYVYLAGVTFLPALIMPLFFMYIAIALLMTAETFYLPIYRVQGVCTALISIVLLFLMKDKYFIWLGVSLFVFFLLFAIMVRVSHIKEIRLGSGNGES